MFGLRSPVKGVTISLKSVVAHGAHLRTNAKSLEPRCTPLTLLMDTS